MEDLFDVIMQQTVKILDAQRCALFIYDEISDQLWSLVATDLNKNEIRISADTGVAGWVFRRRKPLLIHDAYEDPRFYPEIDIQTGFRTRNILCIPLINRRERCIGALQALNKQSGKFTADDIIGNRSVQDRKQLLHVIEDAAYFVEAIDPKNSRHFDRFILEISERLKSFYETQAYEPEHIRLDPSKIDLKEMLRPPLAGRAVCFLDELIRGQTVHVIFQHGIIYFFRQRPHALRFFLGLFQFIRACAGKHDDTKQNQTVAKHMVPPLLFSVSRYGYVFAKGVPYLLDIAYGHINRQIYAKMLGG